MTGFITYNRLYRLQDMGDGGWLLSGHPEYCPIPTLVRLTNEPIVGESVWFTRLTDGELVRTTPVTEVLR